MIKLIAILKKQRTYLLPLISISLILALLLEPTLSIASAKVGLLLWFNTVLPSLLPFIIGSNLLMASGSIYFFEKVFSPIMKPLFNLPGCCAFPWIIGLISGYPMGAKVAGELRANNQITDIELQRLLSFCNNSGPFFILGAVGIGMLGNEQTGYFLLAIHIISSVLVGMVFRFYGKQGQVKTLSSKGIFKAPQAIGEVLGDSITSAMEVIMQIGGYIIIFSVIGTLIQETALIKLLSSAVYVIFKPLGMTLDLALSWIVGVIEMSNGTHGASIAQGPSSLKLAIISFIIGWGGLSVQAQSLSFIKKTEIKISVYLFSKLLHGLLAFTLTYFLFDFM